MMIISYLNDSNDIKSCLELSKTIRQLMLSSPKFFKKHQLFLESIVTVEEVFKFLSNFGGNIKALKIKGNEIEQKLLTFIMKNVANLEELIFETDYTLNSSKLNMPERIFELPQLKKLTFPNDNFRDFILDCKNLNNLESLSIYDHSNEHDDLLTDFIVKLNNLKEFNLIYYNYKKNPEKFPTRDISGEVNFRLTKFSHPLNYNYGPNPVNENLINFFAIQAASLKELSLMGDQVHDIYRLMFKYSKNLHKLTVHRSEDSEDSPFFCEPDEGDVL